MKKFQNRNVTLCRVEENLLRRDSVNRTNQFHNRAPRMRSSYVNLYHQTFKGYTNNSTWTVFSNQYHPLSDKLKHDNINIPDLTNFPAENQGWVFSKKPRQADSQSLGLPPWLAPHWVALPLHWLTIECFGQDLVGCIWHASYLMSDYAVCAVWPEKFRWEMGLPCSRPQTNPWSSLGTGTWAGQGARAGRAGAAQPGVTSTMMSHPTQTFLAFEGAVDLLFALIGQSIDWMFVSITETECKSRHN